jgi:hypothetical protein
VPEDPVAGLWQAATLLREHRGDSELDEVMAGLEPIAAALQAVDD